MKNLSTLLFGISLFILSNPQAFSICSNGIQEDDIIEIRISNTSDLRVHERESFVRLKDNRTIHFHSITRIELEDDLGFSRPCVDFHGTTIRDLPEQCGIEIFIQGSKISCDCTRSECKDYSGR